MIEFVKFCFIFDLTILPFHINATCIYWIVGMVDTISNAFGGVLTEF